MRREQLVTHEKQLHSLRDVKEGYRQLGTHVEHERRSVPLHSLIATQNAIEKAKYEMVRELLERGELDVPVLVEEHYVDGGYRRYLIDGHTRVRARIELGERMVEAFVVWSPAGDWPSNFVRVAAQYGNALVKNLPMI
ncbi:MAG: ParB N-terminal domain-containing protein [Armatimonadota bacterium]